MTRRRRGVRRAAWPLLVVLVLIGLVFVAIVPARAWLQQRDEHRAAESRLEVLEEQNRDLARRAKLLHTDAEIERLAREQYNLVRPGEEAYALLPAGPAPTTTTTTRPGARRPSTTTTTTRP